MNTFRFTDHPHRRYNPLNNSWVQVSPHRAKRPWQGKQETPPSEKAPQYDPHCYLCPGNARAGGEQNPDYDSTYVFTNDFSSLLSDSPTADYNSDDLLIARGEQGICRVICFSPRHDLALPEMQPAQIRQVVDLWETEYVQLGAKSNIQYVQIFENKGQMMGCSNPHPHGQIWAQQTVPDEPSRELVQLQAYLRDHESCLLCDYLALEMEKRERVILENTSFLVVVPFWAVWPFETLLLSKNHRGSFPDFSDTEKDDLAEILHQITVRYDNLFEISFPYSAGIHLKPTDGQVHEEWHFHMHFYPPLLRSATVKKFMVGYEMLANAQRDITPESAAVRLQELPDIHYKLL